MQHYGAPTRLLDFTYSIYVAAYFALEDAEGDCVVWAIHGPWALQGSCGRFAAAGKRPEAVAALQRPYDESDDELFNQMFMDEPAVPCACPQNPFRLNERLRIQKGAFIVPGTVESSFEDNLRALTGSEDSRNVKRLVIPFPSRREALRDLFHMNISRTSLFPGLDGYARSLGVYNPVFEPIAWTGIAP